MEMSVDNRNMDFVASLGLTLAYLVLLMVCGIVGNTLVFLVYYKRFKPSITRTYILAMSVCDLLTNCLALPSDIYEIRFHYDFDDDPGCKFFGYITRFLAMSCALILIAVALDRWRKICRSMKTARTLKHVYIELTCLGVLALCYAIPFGVLRGLQTIPVPNSDINGTTCAIEDKFVGSLFFVIYNASMGLGFLICVSIMSVCYVLIARHLWLHKKRLLQYAKTRRHQGPDQDSNQAQQQQPHKHAEDSPATRPCHDQPTLKMCTPGFTSAQSEDEEDSAGPGVLQMSITEDSDLSGVVWDSDNTTTSNNPQSVSVMSTSLSNISDTVSSTQPQPVSGDVITTETPGTIITKGNTTPTWKKLRETTMAANACKSHRSLSAACRPPLHETPKPANKSEGKKIPTRTTLMMFILAAMFVVSYLPYLSMAALFRGKDMVGANFWEWNLHQIALRSFFINSAVNPLVYSFCSLKFRSECRLLLCRH